MMEVTHRMMGGIILVISLLVSFHYYTAHLVKGMYVPELAIAIIALYVVAGLMLYGKLMVKK
jgi:heme A synthase